MENEAITALVLARGEVYYGTGFGAPAPLAEELPANEHAEESLRSVGEVVFNTAMSGYGEVLTDPSYTGQIVVMTYPHAGNYGIDESWSETGPEEGRSTGERRIKPAGMVVRSLYDGPVPWGRITLADYLRANGVPGITDLDTRALTLDLRDHGSGNGVICRPSDGRVLTDTEYERAVSWSRAFPAMEGRSLIGAVGTTQPVHIPGESGPGEDPGPHLALYDCGTKANIIRELLTHGCSLTLMPATATAEEIRETGAQAILLSNGPGDPAVLSHQVEQTRKLLDVMPILGICLGHQIVAEAVGAKTYKMKFGHHGVNHPVREEVVPSGRERGRVFVTSQNHGFAVEEQTLPAGMQVWFRNANDGSVEGLWDESRRIRTTQFHPESAPGPGDSQWIFSAFLEGI